MILLFENMGRKTPNEYKIELPYGEAHLDILLFNDIEHRWIFTHNYLKRQSAERNAQPILTNKSCLVVNYNLGQVSGIELSMDIKRPDKRGQVYYLGVDISPNSHMFVEFKYEKQGELFRMKSIQTSTSQRVDLDALAKSQVPMKKFEFPFPLKDRVERELDGYKVPFMQNNGVESFFVFPAEYKK